MKLNQVKMFALALALVLVAPAMAAAQGVLFVTGGNVGIGIDTPTSKLHMETTDGTAKAFIKDDSTIAYRALFEMQNTGNLGFRLVNNNSGTSIDFNNSNGEFRLNFNDGDGAEFKLTADGQIILPGGTLPDYVFADDYPLMPLDELAAFIERENHLPNVPSEADVKTAGTINLTAMQMRLLEKVEELTLYTLAQQAEIDNLSKQLAELRTN